MKFRLTFKDPDALEVQTYAKAYESVELLENQECNYSKEIGSSLTEEEKEMLAEGRSRVMAEFARKWIQYGEYITVVFDTEADTCTVVLPNE